MLFDADDVTDAAPPHTRGSTRPRSGRYGRGVGSPAHAGIDLPECRAQAVDGGLPRTRGDRPQVARGIDSAHVAPPHTRGSTRPKKPPRPHQQGSPAHAGIDPVHPGLGSHPPRLPRTRGDRPRPGGLLPVRGRAPPHTRGSTSRGRMGAGRAAGSPAHAGIDPPRQGSRSSLRRLPRTRGDRPFGYTDKSPRIQAPPHTRGSTVIHRMRMIRAMGSPAHAGIDLSPIGSDKVSCWLPRTRGDRPRTTARTPKATTAPPHTRGSTRPDGAQLPRRNGSPAHAGIDLAAQSEDRRAGGLPRTRGDRPAYSGTGDGVITAPPHTPGSTSKSASFPQ